jgi:hypothetical protein
MKSAPTWRRPKFARTTLVRVDSSSNDQEDNESTVGAQFGRDHTRIADQADMIADLSRRLETDAETR